jgi:DNA-binding transcriptional MerR regulator
MTSSFAPCPASATPVGASPSGGVNPSPLLHMTIGQVSRATGMSVDTLRYYERMALLAPPRDAGRRRHYGPQDLLTLSFVARMRATDMPLAEIRTYLALAAQGDGTAEARRALLEAHRTRVQSQLKASAEALEVIDFKLQHFDELSRKIKLATADAQPGAFTLPAARSPRGEAAAA